MVRTADMIALCVGLSRAEVDVRCVDGMLYSCRC
jgi:hypothetical protein